MTIKKDTIQYFKTIEGFGRGIRQVFGDLEEEITVECSLEYLRQKDSVVSYTANFQ